MKQIDYTMYDDQTCFRFIRHIHLIRYIALGRKRDSVKYIIILILIHFSTIDGFCQQKGKRNYATINLASFVSPYHRTIDLAIARNYRNKVHLEVGAAIILPGGNWSENEVGRENGKGVVLKIEPKIVLFQRVDKDGELLNFFSSTRMYRTIHDYVSARYETIEAENIVRYNVNSRVWGLIPHFGFFIENSWIHFEASIGYGIRRLKINNDLNGKVSDLSRIYRFNSRFEPEEIGSYTRGSLSVNFKFGIRF